jgi:hypothetical protein
MMTHTALRKAGNRTVHKRDQVSDITEKDFLQSSHKKYVKKYLSV